MARSDQFAIFDKSEVEEIHREDGEIVAVTFAVVDDSFDDPHEADFACRDGWSLDFIGVDDD